MSSPVMFGYDEIVATLPHRPPFLFVDSVLDLDPFKSIVAERLLRPDEPFFSGHFPGQPIMPGVLLAEALAQASGLLLAFSEKASGVPAPAIPKMYHLAGSSFKFTSPARPGDTLRLEAQTDGSLSGLFRFRARALVQERVVATGTLTLAFMGMNSVGTGTALA